MWEMVKSLAYYALFILAMASILMIGGTALIFIFDMFLVLIGV